MKLKLPPVLLPMHMSEPFKSERTQQVKDCLAGRKPRTQQQLAEIECNKLMVQEYMPELEQFLRELSEAHMISGWSAIVEVKLLDDE